MWIYDPLKDHLNKNDVGLSKSQGNSPDKVGGITPKASSAFFDHPYTEEDSKENNDDQIPTRHTQMTLSTEDIEIAEYKTTINAMPENKAIKIIKLYLNIFWVIILIISGMRLQNWVISKNLS